MEPRNYEAGASGSIPNAPITPSVGYPTSGNPAAGIPATKPGPHWFYKVGESLRKIITDAGLTPNDADLTQLKTALVSPQSDVNNGADDNRFVTPKKLNSGFSVSSGVNAHIKFPDWLGGWIIQRGLSSGADSQGVASINYPVSFSTSSNYTLICLHFGTDTVTIAGLTANRLAGSASIKIRKGLDNTIAVGVSTYYIAVGK